MRRSRAAAFVVLIGLFAGWILLSPQGARCPAGRPSPEDLQVAALARLIEIARPETLARLDLEAIRAHEISQDALAQYVREHPDCCIYGGRETGELTPISFAGRRRGLGEHVVSIRLIPSPKRRAYEHLRFNRCGDAFRGEH